jgi:hypothetical protein
VLPVTRLVKPLVRTQSVATDDHLMIANNGVRAAAVSAAALGHSNSRNVPNKTPLDVS